MIGLRGVSYLDSEEVLQTVFLNKPPLVAPGDVMYAYLLCQAPTASGWTQLAYDGVATTMRKVAGVNEPAGYTFDAGAGNVIGPAALVALSGVDNLNPEDATTVTDSNTGGTAMTAPSITTVTDGAWHLAFYSTLGLTATLITGPPGYDPVVPSYGDPAIHDLILGARRLVLRAGATGTAAATQDDTHNWGATSLAIRPDLTLTRDPGPYAISQETTDRITLEEDALQGVLITETSSPYFYDLTTEEVGDAQGQAGRLLSEDGTALLQSEQILFYAVAGESPLEGILMEDGDGRVVITGGPPAELILLEIQDDPVQDRLLLEDAGGVLISEEFETIVMFYAVDQETGVDRLQLEDASGILISENPTQVVVVLAAPDVRIRTTLQAVSRSGNA